MWVLWNSSFASHCVFHFVSNPSGISHPRRTFFPSHLFCHAPLKRQTGVFKPRQRRFDGVWEVGLRTQKRLQQRNFYVSANLRDLLKCSWLDICHESDSPRASPLTCLARDRSWLYKYREKILRLYFFNDPVTNLCVHRNFQKRSVSGVVRVVKQTQRQHMTFWGVHLFVCYIDDITGNGG